MDQFISFLANFNIIEVSIGTLVGMATKDMTKSMIKMIFEPLIAQLGRVDDLKELSTVILGLKISYGEFVVDLINYLILMLIIFFLVSTLLRPLIEQLASKKKDTEQEKISVMRQILAQLKKLSPFG